MKFIIQSQKSNHPQTHFMYTLINLNLINTVEIWSINITVFNVLFKLLYEKIHN